MVSVLLLRRGEDMVLSPIAIRCLDFRLAPPAITCHRCDWAKYCSRECQWADWVDAKGHQEACDKKPAAV